MYPLVCHAKFQGHIGAEILLVIGKFTGLIFMASYMQMRG